jgi:hypothetical protein
MMWLSYDLVWVDGRVAIREPTRWTDATIDSWRKWFTNPLSESWYVFIDTPDLLVMRAGDGAGYARISINVPEKE